MPVELVWVGSALLFAIVLDLVLIRWLASRWRHPRATSEQGQPEVRVLGVFSPVLTWLKYRWVPRLAPGRDAETLDRVQWFSSWTSEAQSRALDVLLGIELMILGQYAMSQYKPLVVPYEFSRALNEWLRVDVTNLDNVLVGAVLLILGGWRLAVGVRRVGYSETGPETLTPLSMRPALNRAALVWLRLLAVGGLLFAFLLIRLHGLDDATYLSLLWLVIIVLFGLAAWKWDRATRAPLQCKLTRAEVVLLLALLALGLLIATYQLQDIPDSLMGDEGDFFNTARSIAVGDYRPSLFDLGVYSYPIFGSYWQASVLRLFGATLWAWRFASALAGVLAAVPLYLLGRELFGRRVGYLAAWAMLVAPYFLAFARLGYNNSQAILPVALCAWLLYSGLKRKSAFYLFLSGAAAGSGFLTYTAGRLGLVVAALYFVYLFLANVGRRATQFSWRALLPLGSAFVVGWAVVAAPHLVWGNARDPSGLRYKTLESVFINADAARPYFPDKEIFAVAPPKVVDGRELFFNPSIYARLILRGLVRSLLVFHHKDLVTEHFIASPLAGPVAVVFYGFGLALLLARLCERRFAFLAIWFFSGLIFLSALNTFPPRHQHLMPIIPIMALLIGLGLDVVVLAVASFYKDVRRRMTIRVALLASGVIAITAAGLWQYFNFVPRYYRPDLDQTMNWAGPHNPASTTFVYLYRKPGLQDWKPFYFARLAPSRPFFTLNEADVLAGRAALPSARDLVVFFEVNQFNAVAAALARQMPSAVLLTFVNRDQVPVGGAMFIGRFVPPTFTPILAGLSDLLTSPVMWLAGPLLLLGVALALLRPRLTLRDVHVTLSEPPVSPVKEPQFEPDQLETAQPLAADARAARAPVDARPVSTDMIQVELNVRVRRGGVMRLHRLAVQRRLPRLHALLPMLSAPMAGIGSTWNSATLPGAGGLILLALLAAAGQFVINRGSLFAGGLIYLAAGTMTFAWAMRRPESARAVLSPGTLSPRAEWVLAALVILIAVSARFYDAGNKPYGLEGDETKWVMQSYFSTVLDVPRGDFGHHFEYQPVSFYLQGLAMRMLGIGFLVPRYLNALLSCLSVVLFYFLARRALGPPVALVATLLYGVSFVALNAGRQALHDTHIEIWVLLTFFLLIEALDTRRDWLFGLSGVAAALGLLTYETFYMPAVTAFVYLCIQAVRNRSEWRTWLKWMGLFLLPVTLAVPNTLAYVGLRQGYHLGLLREFMAGSNAPPLANAVQFLATRLAESLSTLFYRIRWPDSLLNWDGPFVNPLLLPFFIVGLALALYHIRRRHYLFFILWFVLEYFPFGALGAPFPRVLYPAVMSIYALAALGLCSLLLAVRRLDRHMDSRVILVGFVGLLAALTFLDLSVFSTQLRDPDDRRKRRELSDLIAASVRAVPVTYLPYLPFQNDVMYQETNLLEFTVAGVVGVEHPTDYYLAVPFEQLLSKLWDGRNAVYSVRVIWDKTAPSGDEERQRTLNTLLRCYQGKQAVSGKFFDVYTLTNLAAPACHGIAEIAPISPQPGALLPANQPVTFAWQTGGFAPLSFRLVVQTQNERVVWLEAEDFSHDAGWYEEAVFAGDYSGAGYLTDSWQSGEAAATVTVEQPGRYTLWVRSYRRVVNDQHNFISLDRDPPVEIAVGGPATFNRWQWEALATASLGAGAHTLTFTRTYGSDPHFSLFLDAVALSSDPSFDPNTTALWRTAFDSGEMMSSALDYTLAEGLPAGRYRWHVGVFEGERLVSWQGQRGIQMPDAEFTVRP